MSSWQIVLIEPAKTMLNQIGAFVVLVFGFLVILLIGWLLAKIVRTLVTKALRYLKLDELSDKIELDNLLERGGIKYSLSELLGVIAYWLMLLITFMVALNAVGLPIAADLLQRVVLFVPNIVAAIFIVILGFFIATMLRNIVQTAANNAGFAQANALSKFIEVIVAIFTVVTALKQLRIDTHTIDMVIMIVFGALGLAAAIAFGVGCKEIAAKFAADFIEKLKTKK